MAAESPPLVLSKYERVQIIAARVEQLLAGAPPLIDDVQGEDVKRIAETEIARRVLPMRVARALPNNKVRVHDLRDFIDPNALAEAVSVKSKLSSIPEHPRPPSTRSGRVEAQDEPQQTETEAEAES